MQYNNEFSVIDTEEKAYVLGQIYGDGYNWRSGIRNGKRRLRCMSCGKRFTRTMPTQEVILGAINP